MAVIIRMLSSAWSNHGQTLVKMVKPVVKRRSKTAAIIRMLSSAWSNQTAAVKHLTSGQTSVVKRRSRIAANTRLLSSARRVRQRFDRRSKWSNQCGQTAVKKIAAKNHPPVGGSA